MKHQFLRMALAVPLLLHCTWPRASIAQAAIGYAVLSWGDDASTTVPVAAQTGVRAIAGGYYYTVALKNDGSVISWGNTYQTTVPDEVQSGVTAIAAGHTHTVALKNDGTVVAWGHNGYGQTRVPLAAQSGVMAIAAGGYHTVALKNDRTVVAWGFNADGQTTIPLTAQTEVTAIAAGGAHAVALKNDGTVVAWGHNGYGQTSVPLAAQSGVVAIAAGSWHTVALVTPTVPIITTQPVNQVVNEWQHTSFTLGVKGYPLNYQWRKDGLDIPEATSATYTLPFTPTSQAGNYTVVVRNSLGSVTSAPPAVLTVNPAAAGAVVALDDVAAQSGMVAIAAGPRTLVALKNNGMVLAWRGDSPADVPIAATGGVNAIAAGGYCNFGCDDHIAALKNDGTVVEWGYSSGQLTGAPTDDFIASPVTLAGEILRGVTAIAAGGSHTVALKNDGTVVAWGSNGSGQVTGVPTDDFIASPVTLAGQILSGVTAIAAGGSHTVALRTMARWQPGDQWFRPSDRD
ncbi:MAG: hypothetical protein U1G07_17155 [Verrucomicrobiota bacterium]